MNKKEIIFLIRAYNDMDIQMSFIAAMAEDGRFDIRVIGYPCDGDMGSPQNHEGVRYMRDKYGVSFETVLDKAPAPLHLRVMYKIEQKLAPLRHKKWARNPVLGFPLKAVHVGLLITMRKMLKGELPWLKQMTDEWDPLFINIDEAIAQKGRAYMLDEIIREKADAGVPVYIIKTGNDTYFDPMPNKSENAAKCLAERNYIKTPAKRYIVPCFLDVNSAKENFPEEEPEIHGNLRMDRSWVKRLHEEILVPPYMDKQFYMDKLPTKGTPKVVFMLSKLGYGIKVDELKETIKLVAGIQGVSCAIKPHTRGMKFDFMDTAALQDVAIVPDVPSTLLIEWADVLLFTGSSIAYHAMILNKRVGFLQNCQYLETIFDDGVSCDKFDTLGELEEFLAKWRDQGEPQIAKDVLAARKKWQADNIHGGLENGLTAQHYKELYLEDLGLL